MSPFSWQSRVESALAPGSGVVVAVSGGGDSVALLRLVHDLRDRLDLRVSIAHLDHGTRGDESRDDGAFVAALAATLGLPFDLGHWRPDRPGHFEADARKARYAWLAEVARNRGASHVATGHTRDDQAETILFRILRGTGPRGLAGMPRRRLLAEGVTLIRPLLDASREELRAYLAAIGQSFREDASNADLSRTRNKIRHDLLPKLAAEYNPRVAEALARLGDFARQEFSRRSKRVETIARHVATSVDSSAIVIRRGPLSRLPINLRAEVIRRLWRIAGWPEVGMTAARWLRLAGHHFEGVPRFSVGEGIDAWVGDETIRLAPAPVIFGECGSDPVRLTIPGRVDFPDGCLVASLGNAGPGDEEIDRDRVEPWSDDRDGRFLIVVGPEDGDRFDPLGMSGRTQALNDFFRGRGVEKADRREVRIVRDRVGIVWVVGHRIAERVKRTDTTRETLILRWEPGDLASRNAFQ